MHPSASETGSTLFALLASPNDQDAWERFVDRYEPKIFAWCRGYGLQQADAEDVTQQILLKVVEKVGSFPYDPMRSFRGWLKTLTRHAVADLFRGFDRLRGSGDSRVLERLRQAEARNSLEESLAEAFDLELLEQAMLYVQLRVEPRTWRVFELTALQQHSGAEVAGELKINVAAVYMAKSRVQSMLKTQIQEMDAKP